MENISGGVGVVKQKDQMELPPGFRFHPTDEELITHYLSKKVVDSNFSCVAIADVDMNKVEPWDLPWRAKLGEKEWYFFCVRDKKYPTGLRTNRATAAGYWKATGKDKEIFRGKALVGMKKTLVFYMGRAPKGEKSNWVTHEYRLEASSNSIPKPVKNDWVISRVFQKTSGGKKVHIDGLLGMRMGFGNGLDSSSSMPPLMDGEPESSHGHVPCFSNPIIAPLKSHQEDINTYFMNPSNTSAFGTNPFQVGQFSQIQNGIGFQFPGSSTQMQDPAVLRNLIGNYGQYMNNIGLRKNQQIAVSVSHESPENSSAVSNVEMGKRLFEEQEGPPSTTIVQQDLDYIWGY